MVSRPSTGQKSDLVGIEWEYTTNNLIFGAKRDGEFTGKIPALGVRF